MGDKNYENELQIEEFVDGSGENSSKSDFLVSEVTVNDENSSSEDSSSPTSTLWPIQKKQVPQFASSRVSDEDVKKLHLDNHKLKKKRSSLTGNGLTFFYLPLYLFYYYICFLSFYCFF